MVMCNMYTWEIRYSKYIGDLSIFDKKIYSMQTKDLHSVQIKNGIFVTVDNSNNQPMMIEVRDADKKISGIDKMDKTSIINTVKECIA